MTETSRKRRSAAEWTPILDDWRSSGETLVQYAERRGLNAGTLGWWRRRLGRGGGAGEARGSKPSLAQPVASANAAFARVMVAQPAPEVGRLEVIARSGHVVRVVGQVDAVGLRALLGALDAC